NACSASKPAIAGNLLHLAKATNLYLTRKASFTAQMTDGTGPFVIGNFRFSIGYRLSAILTSSQLRRPSLTRICFFLSVEGKDRKCGALPREPITSMSTELVVATLAGLTVCAVVSAFFSGMETALF